MKRIDRLLADLAEQLPSASRDAVKRGTETPPPPPDDDPKLPLGWEGVEIVV